MNSFYLGLIIGAILIVLYWSYTTYYFNVMKYDLWLAISQNEEKFNPDVQWIGKKASTIFDDSMMIDIESAALLT